MKILFVCWANVGRSQMAAAFYNKFTSTDTSSSAGTDVDYAGETLLERRNRMGGTYTIEAMKEEGIDLSDSKRTLVTKEMIKEYDKIINMAQLEYTPEWLSNSPNYIRWEVSDPGGKNLELTLTARDIVKFKVSELLKIT